MSYTVSVIFNMDLAHIIALWDSVRGAEFVTQIPDHVSRPSVGEGCQNHIKISQVNNLTGLLLFMGGIINTLNL